MGLAEVVDIVDIVDIADILQTYCRRLPQIAVEIGGVSWAWQKSRTLWILQTYCRYIADILPQIAADCGGKRQIVMEGVTGCVP